MSRQLVITSTEREGEHYFLLSDIRAFLRVAEKHNLPPDSFFPVMQTDGVTKFVAKLPSERVVKGKRVRLVPKNKPARKVDEQVEEHRKAKEEGQEVGYVPPVGRTTAPKPQKIRCPHCGTRKPIQNIAKVRTIKPHVIQGEPCAGSGMQVSIKGRVGNRKGS